jgi:hypothetical protein
MLAVSQDSFPSEKGASMALRDVIEAVRSLMAGREPEPLSDPQDRKTLENYLLARMPFDPKTAIRDYRIDRTVLPDESNETLAWSVIEPIWFLPTPQDDEEDAPPHWQFVTKGQRLIYAVTWLEREALNGGFAQYFYNPTAWTFQDALDGLQVMNRPAYVDLLIQCASHFPDGRPSRIRTIRQEQFNKLADAERKRGNVVEARRDTSVLGEFVFHADDEKFYELYGDGADYYRAMADYVRQHPGEFFR